MLQTVNGNDQPVVVTRYDANTPGSSTTPLNSEKEWNLLQEGVRGWWDECIEFVFEKNSPVGKLKTPKKEKYPAILKISPT